MSLPIQEGKGTPWHEPFPWQETGRGVFQATWPGPEGHVQAEAAGIRTWESVSGLSCSWTLNLQGSPCLRLLPAQPPPLRSPQTISKCPRELGNTMHSRQQLFLLLPRQSYLGLDMDVFQVRLNSQEVLYKLSAPPSC